MTMVALLLLGYSTILEGDHGISASQISGTSYSSPSYGYSINWQLPWYVIEEDVDTLGFDILGIADGQSTAYFRGFPGRNFGVSSATEAIDSLASEIGQSSGVSGFQEIDDSQCQGGLDEITTAAACYRYDALSGNGALESQGLLIKSWDLGGGVYVLLEANSTEETFHAYLSHWHSFGVYGEGESVPPPGEDTCNSENHYGTEFCFDTKLNERSRSDIVEGIRLGQDAIAKTLMDQSTSDLHVTGLSSVTPSGAERVATTFGESIAVFAGSEVWQAATPIERIEVLVHEYFHVFQISMAGSSSTVVPLWFTEGSAESFGNTVVSQIGVTDQAEFYSVGFYKLTMAPVAGSLRDFGTSVGMTADEYALAYMAVQYLLGSKGLSVEALAKVYKELGNGSSFDAAFASVFGMSLDQFYADFESWRLGMTQVYSLDDDFYPNDGFTSAVLITWKSFPKQVRRGDQLVFVAQTSALADCDLSLNLSGQSIQRTAWANGQGEIFWLVSLPEDAVAGNATVNATCGGVPISSVMVVT